jgi:hypothetical protein
MKHLLPFACGAMLTLGCLSAARAQAKQPASTLDKMSYWQEYAEQEGIIVDQALGTWRYAQPGQRSIGGFDAFVAKEKPASEYRWFTFADASTDPRNVRLSYVEPLTDAEYTELLALRKAVREAERRIALAHHVFFSSARHVDGEHNAFDATSLPDDYNDAYEFRGPWLLIDFPPR